METLAEAYAEGRFEETFDRLFAPGREEGASKTPPASGAGNRSAPPTYQPPDWNSTSDAYWQSREEPLITQTVTDLMAIRPGMTRPQAIKEVLWHLFGDLE